MKCDRCDNPATVHELKIKGGKRHEVHLCEACAKGEGVAPQTHIPITQLLNQFITSQMQGAQAAGAGQVVVNPSAGGACPSCGTTIAQFRQSGLLGCPDCYAAFEGQLAPLLQRAHEGATHHTGKKPPRLRAGAAPVTAAPAPAAGPRVASSAPAPKADPAARIAAAREKLAEAVKAEKYEEAARLRDELRALEAEQAAPAKKAARATRTPPEDQGGSV